MEILEEYADNMRYALDLLCYITDFRNSLDSRIEETSDLLDRESLHKPMSKCREVFRNIANRRTDLAKGEQNDKDL